ncbi:MAG: response regulator [Chloroflexi bacterium]|nr:MAG: response regulator [Chloroflexota bacterium]
MAGRSGDMMRTSPRHRLRSVVITRMPRRQPHVLVVEDDRMLAEMYRLSLLLDGFIVEVAPDGEAGIQRVTRGRHPDAIVLDLNRSRFERRLSRRDGLDLLSMLRASPSTQSIPVVVLASDPQDFEVVLRRGATACLARWRSTPADLIGQLDALLHRRSRHR